MNEITPRFLQVKVMCRDCGHIWPQLLNKHLDDIECYRCGAHHISVIHINDKDLERWQSSMENVEATFLQVNAEILQQLQDSHLV